MGRQPIFRVNEPEDGLILKSVFQTYESIERQIIQLFNKVKHFLRETEKISLQI